MRQPGPMIPGPRTKAKKQWASMVYLAIAAFLGALLLVKTIRGCQQHRHSHQSSEKWTHASAHGLHAGTLTSESIGPDTASEVEAHRHEGMIGMVRRASATSAAASATATVLVDYQVHQPVLTPEGATLDSGASNGEAGEVQDSCQVVLMDYVFAYSYGEPYVGELFP